MIHSLSSSKFWKESHLGLSIHPGVLISNLSYHIRTPTPFSLLPCPSFLKKITFTFYYPKYYLVLLFTSASKAGTQIENCVRFPKRNPWSLEQFLARRKPLGKMNEGTDFPQKLCLDVCCHSLMATGFSSRCWY